MKTEKYNRLYDQIKGYVHTTSDIWARLATIEAVLHHKIPYYFWTGVYVLDGEELIVRSYQGPVACQKLKGEGVCISAIRTGKTLIVRDVMDFPGHIACNPASKSEMVIPLYDREGRIFGCFDIDSDKLNAFDEDDEAGVKRILSLLYDN